MNRNTIYFKQARLLVRILPIVAEQTCFALKGGTAINLFVQDLPRLSVDIDLACLPVENRDTSLANIHAALAHIAASIEIRLAGIKVQKPSTPQGEGLRLLIESDECRIKLELSPVLRGTVWPVEMREIRKKVDKLFGYAEMNVVSEADLYAGKFCAALDRQHPRDLFDVKQFFDREGQQLKRELTKIFLVYLISHSRPISELLAPNRKNIAGIFERELAGMTTEPVLLEDLVQTREDLIAAVHTSLMEDDRAFLCSFKRRLPDWSLLNLPGVEALPAVRWKLLNLEHMPEKKHQAALEKLNAVLNDH